MLINAKMPTVVIVTFMSRKNFVLSWVEHNLRTLSISILFDTDMYSWTESSSRQKGPRAYLFHLLYKINMLKSIANLTIFMIFKEKNNVYLIGRSSADWRITSQYLGTSQKATATQQCHLVAESNFYLNDKSYIYLSSVQIDNSSSTATSVILHVCR